MEERCLWRSELVKSPSILPLLLQAGGRACKAQLGHLLPSLPGCRAAANMSSKPHQGPEAQASAAREDFSLIHPFYLMEGETESGEG